MSKIERALRAQWRNLSGRVDGAACAGDVKKRRPESRDGCRRGGRRRDGRSIAARPTRAVAVRIASAWRAGSMIGCSAPGEREDRCDDARTAPQLLGNETATHAPARARPNDSYWTTVGRLTKRWESHAAADCIGCID
ncbi:hypothetical protein V4E86_28990 [Burkholderia pseudomallei]|nr:hypothetical protein [Burkholderia pseudomallei]MDA0559427.1 hypothetical protein [Burkholderia pseudomallei]MDV2111306.1 hypothetical protein [Burkholderia pseudomallei]MDV2180242.1 hypothetical protein [Burkholderia pseudomallei]MDV2185641.1 hypothetical protein [Burkholderia pseudomallei]MDV2209217.1 hypothetical protein [Burkholderia pseudomallei]